ncbi:hypothetical protein [Vibrio sp. 1978]|uniref:hypothetical protein n=1 Tax=Vibrio sp. 1978 TaxID=3074585 RepID=UPI002966291E|nr:hypothetical protein [Vibrio sp. 1978]MDW3055782.1 hypothetical protein [Vibrio sp. 1978]
MRAKAYLKVSVPIAIAEALQELPEYNKISITQIIFDLTQSKLKNNSNESNEVSHESTIN